MDGGGLPCVEHIGFLASVLRELETDGLWVLSADFNYEVTFAEFLAYLLCLADCYDRACCCVVHCCGFKCEKVIDVIFG